MSNFFGQMMSTIKAGFGGKESTKPNPNPNPSLSNRTRYDEAQYDEDRM